MIKKEIQSMFLNIARSEGFPIAVIRDGQPEWVDAAPSEAQVAQFILRSHKRLASSAIVRRANAFTSPIICKYSDAEKAGWDKREAEANSIIAASDKAEAINATVIIKSLAAAANEDTAATVKRAESIVAKATQFAAISAAVEIMRDSALTAIDAVADPADMPTVLAALDAQAIEMAKKYGLA